MPRVIGAVSPLGGAFRLGLLVSVTVALGCDGKSSTHPSPPPPFAASVSPHTGSTGGGTNVSVTGSAFQIGATVTLGGAPVSAFPNGTGTVLSFTTLAHAAGSVDVVVRNPDGQSVTLSGAYVFVPPGTFDFNGNWFAYLGDGNDDPFSFKVEGNALVSLTCYEGTPVTLPSPLPVSLGEVAASVNGIVIFSAVFVGPDSAVGTINAGLCHSQGWSGWKDQPRTALLTPAMPGAHRLPTRRQGQTDRVHFS
jgi:IPT/TIG domain-containing protein